MSVLEKTSLRALLLAIGVVATCAAAALPLRAQEDAPASRTTGTAASPLPPGEGRDIVAVTCSQCHGLSAITHLREGRVAWRHQIYDMVGRGAQVTPAEIDTMVNYLVANFGPGIPFPGQTPSSVAIAPGTGSDVVMQKCILCHGVDRVVAAKRTPGQWATLVKRMVYLGATLTPDQTTAVVTYLSTNYAPKM